MIVVCCVICTIIFKLLLDESIDEFLTVKLLNIKSIKSKLEETSLTEALKKRFKENQDVNEKTTECPENTENQTIYKEKFNKVSKNLMIVKKSGNKKSNELKILSFANNYLAFNQTNKPKTGI